MRSTVVLLFVMLVAKAVNVLAFTIRQQPFSVARLVDKGPAVRTLTSSVRTSTGLSAMPFVVIVEAEINPDRLDEFLPMIQTNAENSRKEPACMRFDVLQVQGTTNKFFFYEVYDSVEAIDYHKKQPHYQAWADFKESGGVISSTTHKSDGLFMT
jgi:(4S)-4-hydroxy-5-phosphonooxypentane-2,3-dione isomerase